MSSRVVAIVQARMSSSRLPGKVLLEIHGAAMLARVVSRASRARTVDEVLVATSTETTDDVLADFCATEQIHCVRGSQFDVLDRYYQAASATKAEIVVRITADCPAIDPALVDDAVGTLAAEFRGEAGSITSAAGGTFDFVANRLPPPWKRTYPIGLDTEVCTFASLQRAWREANEPGQREHVMPYFYEGVTLSAVRPGLSTGTSPRGFRIGLLNCEVDLGAYRWTVDTAEDLEFMRRLYDHFGGRDDFSWSEILEVVHSHPQLMQINAAVRHKTLRDVDERALGN